VALFMESSPEYVCMWLGLSKIGVIPALINFNLRMNSMVHCINAADAKALIFTDTLAPGMCWDTRHMSRLRI
jgi:solute carrier family 27 fatty acid transporter 1/4